MVLRSEEMVYDKKVAWKGIKTFDPVSKACEQRHFLLLR